MSGGFFRGTSADQDTRFSNKQAKLLKSQKFAPELDHPVDMTKVKMDVIRPWIATRATELLGFEDEVLINFVYGLLDGKEVDGKQIQIQLTGFMEKNTGKFMKELWSLLLSAQNNVSGVPQQFLDAKEEEQRKKKEENDIIAQEIQKRKERTGRESEREKQSKMDSEDGETKSIKTGPDFFSQRRASSGQPGDKSEEDREIDQKTRNQDGHRSRSRSASSQTERFSISPRKWYQSPVRRSLTPERWHRSPRIRSISPRNKYAPTRSLSRERAPHARRRSISPPRHRSPYRQRTSHLRRLPYIHRRSPSPLRRRSRSPIRHRSPPFRRRSPSPLPHRYPPTHRRSPQVRMKSPSHKRSPVRYMSPSPLRYQSSSPIRRSPQPRTLKQQKQSPHHSPLSQTADPVSHGYKNRSLSPSGSESPLDNRRLDRKDGNHVDSAEPGQPRNERKHKKRLPTYNGLGRELAKEDDSEESPVHSKSQTGLHVLPRVNSRDAVCRRIGPSYEPKALKLDIRYMEHHRSDVDDRQVSRHAIQSSQEIEYGPGGARHVHDGQNSAKKVSTEIYGEEREYTEHEVRNNDRNAINDVQPRLKVADFEHHREREHGNRHHKRSDYHEKGIDKSSKSEVEDRKETKRRRKEEKKLRKEEKRRRHEERHRRRLERRAAKQKAKANDTASPVSDFNRHRKLVNESEGNPEDAISEQKRLEIELREKALESLRAKKAISD